MREVAYMRRVAFLELQILAKTECWGEATSHLQDIEIGYRPHTDSELSLCHAHKHTQASKQN